MEKQAPRDYGIMGFDDIELLEYLSPRLSTIYNSVEEVAKRAVELLFDEMEGRKIAMKPTNATALYRERLCKQRG